MLELKKKTNESGYNNYYITTEQGTFRISFEDNLDLYWTYLYSGNISLCKPTHEFIITKENFFLYQVFDDLFTAIKKEQPYSNYPYDDELKKEKVYTKYNPNKLYNKGKIKWYSDDEFSDIPSSITIEKKEDYFSIIFEKSKDNGLFITFSIRFRNRSSRYEPYNASFMNMYNKLSDYNPDYHQIHIEEYMYNQDKLIKKKTKKNR